MTCPSTVPFMNRRCLQPGLLWETLTSTLHCCWHWRFSCGCHEDRSRQCHASKRTSLRNLLDFDVTDKCASNICALLWNLFFQCFEAVHPGGPGRVGFGGWGVKKSKAVKHDTPSSHFTKACLGQNQKKSTVLPLLKSSHKYHLGTTDLRPLYSNHQCCGP